MGNTLLFAAVEKGDLPRYVAASALMSEIYRQNGDLPSAYRALAEVEHALVAQLGEKARELVRPHILALADSIGRNKFMDMVDNIHRAQHALDRFEREES